MTTPASTPSPDAETEADLINGRACAGCGDVITTENRVPHGGFWVCMEGCADDGATYHSTRTTPASTPSPEGQP